MPLIPEDTIAQVLDRTDIVEIVSNYVSLKKAGRNFKGLSPFNDEKTPSFVVSPDKQIFSCFSTGIGGNVVKFVMHVERMEFPEAVRFLAKKANVEIPESPAAQFKRGHRDKIFEVNALAAEYYHNLLISDKSPEAVRNRDYLKSRGVSLEAVTDFQLGMALNQWDGLIRYLKAKNISLRLMEQAGLIIARDNKEGYYDRFRDRIIFPILDVQSRVIAFGARSLDNSGAKYINSPETDVYTKGQHLYGFHLAKKTVGDREFVVIVEGYLDCIMPFQTGFKNIAASLGTALTAEQVGRIRRFTKDIVMLYDNDKAGEAAMIRSFDMLIEQGMNVRVASLAEGEDPDSFIRKNGLALFEERIKAAKDLFDYKLDKLCEKFDARSVTGQARICDEMLPTINRYANAIMQASYISRLAKKIGVSEPALKVELRKVQEGIRRPKQEVKIAPKRQVTVARPVESSLLKLLLDEQDYIELTRHEVSLDDFKDAKIRGVISKLFDLYDQGTSLEYKDLVDSFPDQETVELISRLATDDQLIPGDKKKIHTDCLNWIKKDRLKSQRKELVEQMRLAEQAGDQALLAELREKFNQSIKN